MIFHKICTRELWEETERTGMFPGMPMDLKDGFIHLSTEEQSSGTIRKYFRGQRGLMLLSVDSEKLSGDHLKWEESLSGGKRKGVFPHWYAPLPRSAIVDAMPFDAAD